MTIDEQISEVLRLAGVQLDEVSKQEYISSKKELGDDTLYHGTDLVHAYRIFQSNYISGETPIQVNSPKEYVGVSTSRNYHVSFDYVVDKGDAYVRNYPQRGFLMPIVVFSFDKQQLKSNHKIIPYDFYGSGDSEDAIGFNEAEEVVIGTIKNAREIIKKVILNKDAKLLLDKNEIGKFLFIKQHYRPHQEVSEEEITSELIKEEFPLIDEFTTFLKTKLVSIKLNEELIYAENSSIDDNIYRDPELKYVILKNPSRKEFKENNMTLSRWCFDNEENFYFCDAYDLTHEKMESILSEKGIFTEDMMGFYDYTTNTISCRDDYNNDPELKEKYRQSSEKELKKIDYFNKTFGDFKYENFSGEYPERV